ncbi:MAG: glutamine amidotransferase [Actinomycetota bacterium]|nr:glutamine amidotransferase [Actinomycetota bacterium]MDQ3733043.1 glutamine amidotransferase [Actinomycetota bacterium]
MCGIVGLHLKSSELQPRLGELIAPMLDCMSSRGPDSAGVALFDEASPGRVKLSLHATDGTDWDALGRAIAQDIASSVTVEALGDVAILVVDAASEPAVRSLRKRGPSVTLVGVGHTMEIFKDVGLPREIIARYGIEKRSGFQAVGHTRMATESAVTTEHSHPFAPAGDIALVHNGSFSNPATVRRRLEREGIRFDTDNDSEVCARFVARQMQQGADLGEALRMVQKDLDGFFTLLVATGSQFAVLRDSFACKPAVIAETDSYVAMSSEYHALAGLPGIQDAHVFEPVPEEVYAWTR